MRCPFIQSLRPALVLGLLVPSAAIAGPLPERFTLGKAVPGDCWLYVHSAKNPQRAWIDQQWEEVFTALKNSGIDADLIKLVMSSLSEQDRAEAQATLDKVTNLLKGVQFGRMVEREFAFAERFAATQLGFDYIFIARGAEGSGEANAAGLVAIFKEVTTAFGGTVNQSKVQDADIWELSHENFGKTGLSIALFRTGDTIGLTTSRKSLEDVLGLYAGKSEAKSIIDSPRFHEALALVKTPQDVVSFFDVKAFVGSMGRMFDTIVGMKKPGQKPAEPGSPQGAEKNDELTIIKTVLALADVFDYSITSVATEGRRQLKYDAFRIQEGKEKTPLASAILDRKPFDRFDRFIPAEATGFQLTGLLDLGLLYDTALDFVVKNVPDGAAAIEQWKGMLASVGFDPKADLFDWLGGEMISVSMPPAVVTPMGGEDWALMIRAKKPEVAKAKVDALVSFVKAKLAGEGQMLMITPAKVNSEGFQEITHPSIAMFFKPVIGVHGEWLMVGSSASALNKCLDVDAGKAPSVAKNARFAEEGLIPKGPVRSASFKDTSKFGQELGAAVGMAGMFAGMAVAGMPEKSDDERQGKRIVQSLLSIVMKLGPVLQKIDFYSSESSIGTFDGKRTLLTESVVTYKKSKDEEAKTAETPKTPAPPEAPKPKP